ncbi:polar amino acid ABC transporter permease [Helicobacter sp. MIT 00-7814]|uniref:amino acid ABC transporter permease n=1 Tax=unclassified Helicobacter TaxID=2593540 RepID=UPI000E1E4CE3|nr:MULTISPECIES: amino acid ABC transporter permease [unclassified Helicobacter]RDU53016.1 polar amino acid ABC transporter permease [Helicobacter sp. MIT 99-10781]RDU55362.1 polar amino acid ABC transporter permease [Helicobacter sp. MIT 00-7814]
MFDWEFVFSHAYLFKDALILTLQISAVGILLSFIIGFVCALLLSFRKIFFLSACASVYTEIARNTPLVLQIFFLYFGLNRIGLELSAFWCASLGLMFLGGGYMCESFRAGLQSVGKSQIESALSLGFNKSQIMRFVLVPQALGVSMPSIAANVIFLIKETSVVSVIALADVLYVSKDIISVYSKTYEALFMLLCAYLVVLLPLSIFFSFCEKRFRI